jgi:hypothetical protein
MDEISNPKRPPPMQAKEPTMYGFEAIRALYYKRNFMRITLEAHKKNVMRTYLLAPNFMAVIEWRHW